MLTRDNDVCFCCFLIVSMYVYHVHVKNNELIHFILRQRTEVYLIRTPVLLHRPTMILYT